MDVLQAAEAGAKNGGSGYWQLALVLLAIGMLSLLARWRKAKAPPPAPSARELRERDHDPDRYRSAADKAIVEMLEMSRTLNAQVDTKIRMLNRLVKDAEEKSARLERLLARAGVAIEDGKPPEREAPPSGEPAPSASGRLAKAQSGAFVSDLQERIFMLHDEGKTVAEIAKATNLSTTEVRFAIDSHKRI